MPLFNVVIERTYTARHLATVLVDAADGQSAQDAARRSLSEGELDPSEPGYRDTNATEGYDDAGSWSVVEAELADREALWAGDNGRCRVCGGSHYTTPACAGATEVRAVDFEHGEEDSGSDVEPSSLVACASCGDKSDPGHPDTTSTWQQWQCDACGNWNDKPAAAEEEEKRLARVEQLSTPEVFEAELAAAPIRPGEFDKAILLGYNINPDPAGGWELCFPDDCPDDDPEMAFPTERAAYEAADNHRMFGTLTAPATTKTEG